MKMSGSLSKTIKEFFSDSNQIQRIVVLLGIALVLAVISFGSYYYYDRYYVSQPKASEVTLSQAEQAVRDDPSSLDNRIVLAETYMMNGRWDDAIKQADQVSATDPDEQYVQRVWLVVGVSHANNGRPQDAIEPLTKFVDARKDEEMPGVDKQLQAAAYFLGDSYLQLDKPEDAITPLENAVNWSQTDADSMYKLGLAYAGAQQYEKAVNMFHAATTFVPDYLEAYDEMAKIYEILGQPALVKYARGMAAYSQKDYEKARDLLLESAQEKPEFPLTFAGLGRVYEALNDLPNAKTSYETALKLDANNFTAKNGLQRIEALMKQ